MHVQLGGHLRVDQELTGGITYPIWPGNALGSPSRSRKACCHRDTIPHTQKIMDGWTKVNLKTGSKKACQMSTILNLKIC